MGVGINWGKQFCICLCPCDSHYHIWTSKSYFSVLSVGLIYPEKDKSLKDTGWWCPLVSSSVRVKGHIHSDVSIHILCLSIDRQTNALLCVITWTSDRRQSYIGFSIELIILSLKLIIILISNLYNSQNAQFNITIFNIWYTL